MPFITDTWSSTAAQAITSLGGFADPGTSELTYDRTGGEFVFYSTMTLARALSSHGAPGVKGPQVAVSSNGTNRLRPTALETVRGITTPSWYQNYQSNLTDVISSTSVISMLMNPDSMTWNWPKRIQRMRRSGGTTFFFHTNAAGSSLDVLEIELNGSTGNIEQLITSPTLSEGVAQQGVSFGYTDPQPRDKLLLWHKLWGLSREPDVVKSSGQFLRNYMYMSYVTPLIPYPVLMEGHFESALGFRENADEPASRPWTDKFVVEAMYPSNALAEVHNAILTRQPVAWVVS